MDEETQKFLSEMRSSVEQQVGGLSARQDQMAQYMVAQEQARTQARAPAAVAPGTNEKILDELVTNPTRFFAELASTTREQAMREADAKIAAYQKSESESRAVQQFWGDFYAYNTDLQSYAPMVQAAFASTIGEASQRANAAGEQVRGLLKADRERQADAEKRGAQGRRMAAGMPPGMAAGAGTEGDVVDLQEDSHQTVTEMKEWQSKRRGFGG